MRKLIERHKLLKLTQEEKEYVSRPVTTKETELITFNGSDLMNATKYLKN